MKHLQLGRSMVEMLAVLAIIGVLSIGGLMGFKYAIDRKSANDILYDVNVLAAWVQTDEMLNRMTVGQELAENRLEFIKNSTATFTVGKETDKTIYIDASDVPEKVCTKLLVAAPSSVEEIIANDGEGCLAGNANSIMFYLNPSLSSERSELPDGVCRVNSDCPGCGKCTGGKCEDDSSQCSGDKPFCRNLACHPCETGVYLTNTKICQECVGAWWGITSKEQCHLCSDTMYIGSSSASGYCYSCGMSGTNLSGLSRDECFRCNRQFSGENISNGACNPCAAAYNRSQRAIRQADCSKCGVANSVWAPSGLFDSSTGEPLGTCSDCREMATGTAVIHTEAQCNAICSAIKPVWDNATSTCSCPSGSFETLYYGCADCQNTTIDFSNTPEVDCMKCPNRLFVSASARRCMICTSPSTLALLASAAECLHCTNRYYANGQCQLCNGTVSGNGTVCTPN